MKYLSPLLIFITIQLHALTFKSDGTVVKKDGTVVESTDSLKSSSSFFANGHPVINEGFMYNTYPCCEGPQHLRIIKSKNNHPFWNSVPVSEGLDKKKIPAISFTDPFDYERIEEMDANYWLAYEWSKEEYAKDIYEFIKEENGNQFLAITAEYNKNKRYDTHGDRSERGEIWIPYLNLKDKEFWYGWRMKLGPNFEYYDDVNIKFHQIFDHPGGNMCGHPKFSMDVRVVEKWWSGERYTVRNDWGQGSKDLPSCVPEKWYLEKYDNRKDFRKYSHDLHKSNLKENDGRVFSENNKKKDYDWSNFIMPTDSEWQTYKIGFYNTDTDQGFIKVYQNDNLIYDYSGPTINYFSGYERTFLIFGNYRRTNKIVEPQTIYFDDLTFVADKETLDLILD